MATASLISPDLPEASLPQDHHHHHHHHHRGDRKYQDQNHNHHPPSLLPSSLPRDNETAIRKPSHHPTPSAVQHARSQTLDHAITSDPDLVSLPLRFSAPIKRKPPSSRASLLATRLLHRTSQPDRTLNDSLEPDRRFDRAPFIDSPTLYDYPQLLHSKADHIDAGVLLQPRTYLSTDGLLALNTIAPEPSETSSEYGLLLAHLTPDAPSDTTSAQEIEEISDRASDRTSDIESFYAENTQDISPMFASKPSPPHLRLEQADSPIDRQERRPIHIDGPFQSAHPGTSAEFNKPLPRSPGQAFPLASVLGWVGGASPSVTEFSSIASPLSLARNSLANDGRRSTKSSFADDTKADAASTHSRSVDGYLPMPSPASPAFSTSQSVTLVDEMEDELKVISSELAASIRREMDLEDLVDRLQEQMNTSHAPNKRSSDYFSDSGYGSVKLSDYDHTREEIDKIRRKSEQEKASIRLELANKLQDERFKRKELNRQIKELAEKASHVDIAQINSLDANDRIKDLEATCEDLKRKLSGERESRASFEDLLSALKGELRNVSDERDNLRDEVIPELRARIEGLENAAAEHTDLSFESARMQQQLESLRQENSSLRNSVVSGPDELSKRISGGLSRSNSLGPSSLRGPKAAHFALARSDSFKNAAVPSDSREDLAQRLKDVEAQRDALHSALKSLLERQEFQNREHQKRIRILENERQRLTTNSPRKAGFERDMSKLRAEVGILRRRAEEALEQKWQVEKGLGGLKMDLDRAEEEIESLRSLLKEKDILIPPSHARSSVSSDVGREPVSSESLAAAYKALQSAHAESLERVRQLESEAGSAEELEESTTRIEDLASQVQQQLTANADLRERLSGAVSRGDWERNAHSKRIAEMQERLRGLEDQVVSAQTASEERIARHEEEMLTLQGSQNARLRRFQADSRKGAKAAGHWGVGQSLQPIPSKSFEDEAQVKTLRARVAELEKALSDTEGEMQEVVAKMNMAQVEVLNLQEAREAALRETRRLEQLVRQEQTKGRGLGGLFRSA